ncbi:MAG: SusC/RagA family TonB-linked outer membrane protein [Candidatus Cyclobacteriaceae bacterium M2_1C_046]
MKKIVLMLFLGMTFVSYGVWAQERTVSGIVTDAENGSPLPGVNVLLRGTTVGTTTDIDGNYKLLVPSEGGTLSFSFIGYTTVQVDIAGRSVIDIQLESDIKQLSEVVVTAVGIESNKRALGYSVQNVDAEELVSAREANIVNALNQKVAGVNVISASGSPGAASRITIRGAKSINGSNSPLFVVDGIPIDNSDPGNGVAGVDRSNRAIDINPADIQSVTVLKGPAATVLYGIRAANGAVIITTKKGAEGKAVVNFSSTFTADEVNQFMDLQQTYAQGSPRGGVPVWRGPHTAEGFSWGPAIADLEFSNDPDHPNAPSSGWFGPDGYLYDRNGFLVPAGTGNGQPAIGYDNVDNFFVTGLTFDNNLSVSGGNESTTYFISAGWLDQSGVVPTATFERKSFRANLTSSITEKLTVGAQANYVNSGGNRIQRGSNLQGIMLGLVRNTPTFDIGNGLTGYDAVDDPSTYLLPDGSQRSYRAGVYDNPYFTINKNPFVDDVNRIVGNINFGYDITSWMKLTYKLGVDNYSEEYLNAFDINKSPFGFNWGDGSVTQFNRVNRLTNSDLLLLINRDLSDEVDLNVTLGHNYFKTYSRTRSTVGTELAAPDFYHISNASNINASEGIGRRELYGVFADIKVGWKDQLFLNLSGRNDWSSRLPDENNSFFYPAVSLGWDFTQTFEMDNDALFSYGKLRASWGQVGNDAPFLYATDNYFGSAFIGGDGFISSLQFPNFGTNAFERSTVLGNNQLRAEQTSTWEFGADLRFFDGRLGFDLTYYNAETIDQVITLDIPTPTGFSSIITNAGVISNEGFEAVMTANPVRQGDFAWDVTANFTRYETIVEELPEGVENIFLAGFTSTSSRVVEGRPYGALFGSQFQRNDEGRLIVGSDGWPLQADTDGYLGDPNPDWLLGVRNTFTYKGFSLSGLIDIRQGGDIWNGTLGIANYFGVSQITAEERDITGHVFDGVTETGEENTTPVDFANPANGVSSYKWLRYGFGGLSEEVIQDGSWVRLRDLSLSYRLPAGILENTLVETASITLTGRNLFLITDYEGIDPETNLTGASNGFGLDYFNMPNTKSYGVSLNITF